MESPTQSDMEPSSTVRRSLRPKPVEDPKYSRPAFLNESFNRIPTPQKNRNVKQMKRKYAGKSISVVKRQKSISIDEKPPEKPPDTPLSYDSYDNSITKIQSDDTDHTKEALPLEIQGNFVVTKDAGILYPMSGPIQPVFFPSESENSGIIIFKSHSRKAQLNISFPKCFVILSGQFQIDEQGIFNVGDFIKAPAGSKLGIKYMGDSDGFGKIIFFKSHL